MGLGASVLKVKASAGDYKAVFGPYQGTFSNVTLTDFTINQNTTNNPVTSALRPTLVWSLILLLAEII